MHLPDLRYGDRPSFNALRRLIKGIFHQHREEAAPLILLSHRLLACYKEIDSFSNRFTGAICSRCPTPCCVNRHAFPDVEDLIFFEVSGVKPPKYPFGLRDTDACMFLTKRGCMLPRPQRSYRCTWYFCEKVFDTFEMNDPKAFKDFEELLQSLSMTRIMLSKSFYELDPSSWEAGMDS